MTEGARVTARLRHMLDAIDAIERLTMGMTAVQYDADSDRAAAVERYFEKLSEASRHLPSSMKDAFPLIPWRQIADLGNVLRHAYDQVAADRLLSITVTELPVLKTAVVELLRQAGTTSGD